MSTIPRRAIIALPAVPLVLWLAAVGCKTADRADDGTTPSAAPSASAAPTAATADPSQTAATPHPTVTAPTGTIKTDGGAPIVDAGKADAAAASDAGTASAKFKACFDKCQAALQGCLTPVLPDAGGRLPLPPAPTVCQAAFTTCQSACAP